MDAFRAYNQITLAVCSFAFRLIAFGWQMALFCCLLLLSTEALIYFIVFIAFIWHLQTKSATRKERHRNGCSVGLNERGREREWGEANDTHFTRQINVEMVMLFRVLNTDQRVNFSLLTVNQRQCCLQFNIECKRFILHSLSTRFSFVFCNCLLLFSCSQFSLFSLVRLFISSFCFIVFSYQICQW